MMPRRKAAAALLLAALVLMGWPLDHRAQAQIAPQAGTAAVGGVNPEYFAAFETPMQFNFDDAAADSVNGFGASIAFPYFVGVGMTAINVATRDKNLDQRLTISMQTFDVFLHVPTDWWIWVLGTGSGTASYKPDSFTSTVGPVRLEPATLQHTFAKIGFRITAEWSAETSYHRFAGSSNVKISGDVRGKADLDASMLTLGAGYAF